MASRVVTTLPYTEFITATGNYDETRKPIDRIIIHTTVASVQSAINRFSTFGTQVSAHYIIGLDGRIWHGLEETSTAYHAGNYAINQRSIGIEHEDQGSPDGIRTDALYTTSARLVRDICNFYNIPINRQCIFKHSEVSNLVTMCPDSLDIDRIVKEALGTPQTEELSIAQYNQLQADSLQLQQTRTKLKGVKDSLQKVLADLNSI